MMKCDELKTKHNNLYINKLQLNETKTRLVTEVPR